MKFPERFEETRDRVAVRNLTLVGALLAAVSLAACGAGEDSSTVEKPPSKMSAAEIAKLPQIKIRARHGPAPRGLVIHDVRKGSGAVMQRGDTMLVDWAEASYGEALKAAPSARQLKFTFGKFIKGWEEGLPGMKVGGRRELLVPTRLGDTGGPVVYQVDLLAIEPPPK
jgi:peptidylprolyl isomerase